MPRKRIVKVNKASILQVLIDQDKKTQFETLCLERGTTMSDAVRKFIDSELRKHKKGERDRE